MPGGRCVLLVDAGGEGRQAATPSAVHARVSAGHAGAAGFSHR